jgi:hypothetical protein
MATEKQSTMGKKNGKDQRSRDSCHDKLTVKTKLVLQSSGQIINSNSFLINMVQASQKKHIKVDGTIACIYKCDIISFS